MATGKQQDRNIFLRVLKPCRDPIRSWHSLQTFSPPAAVAPVAPNAWAPMHWALTSIGWLEVGPGACSAPSQVSKQVCAPSSAKELPPDPEHVPSTKKKKESESYGAGTEPRELIPCTAIHCKWSPAKSLPSHPAAYFACHVFAVRGTVTQQKAPLPILRRQPSPHRPWGLAEDRTQLVELANSLTLSYHQLTLQLFIDVVFKVLSL